MSKKTRPASVGIKAGPPPRGSARDEARQQKRRKMLTLALLTACLAGAAAVLYFFNPNSPNRNPFAAQEDKTPPKLNPKEPPGPGPEGMVWIPGGEFWMGGEIKDHHNLLVQ